MSEKEDILSKCLKRELNNCHHDLPRSPLLLPNCLSLHLLHFKSNPHENIDQIQCRILHICASVQISTRTTDLFEMMKDIFPVEIKIYWSYGGCWCMITGGIDKICKIRAFISSVSDVIQGPRLHLSRTRSAQCSSDHKGSGYRVYGTPG